MRRPHREAREGAACFPPSRGREPGGQQSIAFRARQGDLALRRDSRIGTPTREEVAAMPVSTRQIGPCFAAEVEGVDMTKPLSPEDVAAIHAGMDQYAVLVFHDQQHRRRAAARLHPQPGRDRARDRHEPARAGRAAPAHHLRRRLEPRQARSDLRPGRPAPALRHRQPPLALRQLVQGDPGEVLAPARAAASRPRAATPSSPTCARRTTRSTTRRGPRSRA